MSLSKLKQISQRVMATAFAAAGPGSAVKRNLAAADQGSRACRREYGPKGSLFIAAVGMAASGMADAALVEN